MRNATVSYCQGLNFVVGHMLRYLTEEEAFWVYCCILEDILPIDYYLSMVGTLVDQKLFGKILKVIMPRLANFFKNTNIDVTFITLQWFVCLYTYNFQPAISDAIWDHLFVKGCKILFRGGLAVISLLEKNIVTSEEFCKFFRDIIAEAFKKLEHEPKLFADVTALTQTMDLKKFHFLTNSFINRMRAKKHLSNIENIKKTNAKNQNKRAKPKYQYICKLALYNAKLNGAAEMEYDKGKDYLENAHLLECSPEWPLCLYDHTYKSRCVTYFAFRAKGENEFIDDYLLREPKEASKDFKESMEEAKAGSIEAYNALVIERNKHYCDNKTFVEKVKRLLEEKNTPDDAFCVEMIDQPAIDHDACLKLMERYVKHVVNFQDKSPEHGGRLKGIPEQLRSVKESSIAHESLDKHEDQTQGAREMSTEDVQKKLIRAQVEQEVGRDDSEDNAEQRHVEVLDSKGKGEEVLVESSPAEPDKRPEEVGEYLENKGGKEKGGGVDKFKSVLEPPDS